MSLTTIRTVFKSSIVRLVLVAIAIVVAVVYRRHLVHAFHAMIWTFPPPSLIAHHPVLIHYLHVLRNITPDISLVLLALAGLSYLMPEISHKIESSKVLRRAVACVLLSFGIAVIVLNEIGREDQEQREKANGEKLESVATQNSQILQAVLSDRTVPEVERRRRIESALRNEYVLSHTDISPAMLAGSEYPPASWMNDRLRQVGEKWTFGEPPAAKAVVPQVIQQIMPELKKAEIRIGFYDDDSGKMSAEREMSIASEDGFTVVVPVTATAVGDVAAENGGVWFRVCETCNWAKEPDGFDPPVKDKPKDRVRKFAQVLPSVLLTPMRLQITTPLFPKTNAFTIFGYYACKNCAPYDSTKPQVLLVKITHPKQQTK